jgi:predicted nucleic acid-binding protein
MPDFVIDASIATAWCFRDEATSYTESLLQAVSSNSREALAPTLWGYEIRNSVLMGLRRRRISEADTEAFLRSLPDLFIRLVEPAFDTTFDLASRHGLTFYDAAYLELALREQLPLASLDKELVRAAERAGVMILKP